MVLTVTLNPAIDKILILNSFQMHKLHRLEADEMSQVSPGGKGVNIAHSLNQMGTPVIATGFAAGHSGHLLCDSLRQQWITTSFIFTSGNTRTNTSILDRQHETLTEINDFGTTIEPGDLEYFIENYRRLLNRVEVVVLAGSLPLGVPHDFYRILVEIGNSSGKKVIVHTSPQNLEPIYGSSPFIINPDLRSCHELFGKSLDNIEALVHAGRELLLKNRQCDLVIFSNRIENVVAISPEKIFILRPMNLKIVNMLGYADAYLAGFIHKWIEANDVRDSLHYASAAGLTDVEDIYKDIQDISLITKNLSRIEIEELK